MTKSIRIPLEFLFEQHVGIKAKLSPDGRFVATYKKNGSSVHIRDMCADRSLTIAVQGDGSPMSISWSRDGTRLFILAQGENGTQVQSYRHEDGVPLNALALPFKEVAFVENLRYQPSQRKVILSTTTKKASNLWEVDLVDGVFVPLAENCANAQLWLCDWNGTPRAAFGTLANGEAVLQHALKRPTRTKIIKQWSIDDVMHSRPLEISSTGNTVFVLDSTGRDKPALTKYCLSEGKFTLCHEVATDGEISYIVVSEGSESAALVGIQKSRMHWHALSDSARMCLDRIISHVGPHFTIIDYDASATSFIVSSETRSGSISIVHIDTTKNTAAPLWSKRTWLDKVQLSKTSSYSIPTRDGGMIECYVTRSRQAKTKPAKALVVCIHAGPWIRDTASFHRTSHWLSDMGFDCIRVNYRGSGGYGKQFMYAGAKKWGAKTCEDIEDALLWASKEGLGAGGKYIMYGHSFGGYAALMCAAQFKNKVIATVALSAPCDLVAHVRNHTGQGMRSAPLWRELVGDAKAGGDALLLQSPLHHASSITCPTFLAHGDSDTVVPHMHSQVMARALNDAHVQCHCLTMKGAGHSYSFEVRLSIAEKVEVFLNRTASGRGNRKLTHPGRVSGFRA